MKKIFVFTLAAVVVALSSYTVLAPKKSQILKGPEVQVHGGRSWTWVQVNKQGAPERLGIVLNQQALESVPVGGDGGHGHMAGNHWIVKLHPKAGLTPFDHVSMHWNPSGHEPEHVYTLPHFDFHFYTTTPEETMQIGTYEQDSVRFNNVPSAEYFPAKYVNPGAVSAVPQMGSHWLDVTSPELNGKPFTETFIFGSFNGKVTFYEPMITLDFLKKTTTFTREIPQPAKVQKSGYYPTKMVVNKNNGGTEVILDGFVYRKQS